jgi:hypothetical protein
MMDRNRKRVVILASIIIASFLFGSAVTAVGPEETSFLEEVWSAIFGIEEEVSEISDDVLVIQSNLELLERIHELEIRLTVLENCGADINAQFPSPVYDSGWHPLTPGEHLILPHNLDTTDYFVYFLVTEEEPSDVFPFVPSTFHNFGTGGAFIENYVVDIMSDTGTYWMGSKNTIDIFRYPDDTVCNYARIMLWKIS